MKKIALALTWDGARWPVTRLPTRARRFLGLVNKKSLTAMQIKRILLEPGNKEIRICWVPLLKGGPMTLTIPFALTGANRLAFRPIKKQQFGELLGIVYQACTPCNEELNINRN